MQYPLEDGRCQIPLELQVQMAVVCHVGAAIEPEPSGVTAYALNH